MDYEAALAESVSAHRPEMEADLAATAHAYEQAKSVTERLGRKMATLTTLLELDREIGFDDLETDDRMTLHRAMQTVLAESPIGMMRAPDIASQIERRRLYRMRDGRPVEPQQVHARAGNYPQLFEREGTFIKLRKQPS